METPPDPAASKPRSEWSSWRRWLPRAAFESGLIVFSVVLAMAVSAWVEDRQTAARVQEMRGFLRAEIRANRDLVAHPDTLAHHERLKRVFGESFGSLDAPVTRETATSAAQTLFATGLHPAPVSDAVWSSVSGGDLMEHMQPQEVFMLATLYRAQANLEDMNMAGYEAATGLVDMIATGEGARPRLMRTLMMLEDMTSQEKRLLVLYDQALADLNDAPRIPVETATNGPGDAAPATR